LVHHLWVKGRHRDRVGKGPPPPGEGLGDGAAGLLGKVEEAALVPYRTALPMHC